MHRRYMDKDDTLVDITTQRPIQRVSFDIAVSYMPNKIV